MKIYTSLVVGHAVYGLRKRYPLERKFVGTSVCETNNPLDIDNGRLQCHEKFCEVKCDEGFDLYQGTRKVRCKQHSKPGPSWPKPTINWNKPASQCRTCNENPTIASDEFTTKCSLHSKAGQRIHKCITTCANRKKINFGQAAPRRRAVHFCRCLKTDNMDRCHWKMGAHYLDRQDDKNHFDSWSCGSKPVTTSKPTTQKPTTTKSTTTKSTTTTAATTKSTTKATTTSTTKEPDNPEVFNIPPGLKCPADSVRGLNRFAQLSEADRIVGGEEAEPHSWPWIARLKMGSFLCGGTIIDNQKILTAAHCCQGFTRPGLLPFVRAVIGDHNVDNTDFDEAQHTATSVTQHPDYNSSTLENDICVITFKDLELRPLSCN